MTATRPMGPRWLETPSRVCHQDRPTAGGSRGSNAMDNRRGRDALIEVGAPPEHQQPSMAEHDRTSQVAMARNAGSGEPGQCGQLDIGYDRSQPVGRSCPTRSQDQRNVMAVDTGRAPDFICRQRRYGERLLFAKGEAGASHGPTMSVPNIEPVGAKVPLRHLAVGYSDMRPSPLLRWIRRRSRNFLTSLTHTTALARPTARAQSAHPRADVPNGP